MHLRQCFVGFIMILSFITHAQPLRKARGKANGTSYSYYIAETQQKARGIVLLMPSRGEPPKKLFWHTAIPRHLSVHGFITIVPSVDYALILEEKTKDILDHVIAKECAKANVSPSRLLIGGFSSGGAIAARYAEYKLSEDTASVAGVFLIDPPLDLARFYTAWAPVIHSACPDVIIDEGKFIKKYLDKIAGGSPHERPDNYLKHAPLLATDPTGGNAKFLKDVPVRLYTEPDLKAMQTKYCTDLTYNNLNSADLDALNELLIRLGNKRVEYIKTTGRGLHSWNIVDPEDLAIWAEKLAGDR